MRLRGMNRARTIAAFWMLFAVVWIYIGNDFSAPLAQWDESIYYSAAQNVLDGRWLLPRLSPGSNPLNGVDPFLEKPPLAIWIQAAAMAIGGESVLVARLPSLFAISGVIGLITLLASRLSRPAAGLFAGFAAMGVRGFNFTRGAADVATDPFLLLFGTGAIYCLVLYVESGRDRWAWISGFAYGAAILTKFVAAAPFGIFAMVYLYRYRERVGLDGFGRIVAGGVIVASPWFLIVGMLEFQSLIDQMLLDQVVDRATGRSHVSVGEPIFSFMNYPYFQRLGVFLGWPLGGLGLSLAVTIGRKRLLDVVSDVDVLMWPLAVGTVLLYAVVGNHVWYIMPAGVAVSVLVGDAIATFLTPILENFEEDTADS